MICCWLLANLVEIDEAGESPSYSRRSLSYLLPHCGVLSFRSCDYGGGTAVHDLASRVGTVYLPFVWEGGTKVGRSFLPLGHVRLRLFPSSRHPVKFSSSPYNQIRTTKTYQTIQTSQQLHSSIIFFHIVTEGSIRRDVITFETYLETRIV